ncbi:ATP-dependent zinc metalloprotease FtsH [Clostridium puniceum]|uniref:ATP-dependent zinc metalloprotease FtsH n=1 Tax=Clostridium puniceum TaxID=29367 RepID=A0A1S8TIN3_9CLOT|nr:hypothetical protein [Clostridium puniceum]OOM77546.1 ATP-dependent zinc metalloprotease FtsH [Clostridium puniceum]
MSDLGQEESIIVIGTINKLDMLDKALLRLVRFYRYIEVSLSDITAREKILFLYLKNKPYENFHIKNIEKNYILLRRKIKKFNK